MSKVTVAKATKIHPHMSKILSFSLVTLREKRRKGKSVGGGKRRIRRDSARDLQRRSSATWIL